MLFYFLTHLTLQEAVNPLTEFVYVRQVFTLDEIIAWGREGAPCSSFTPSFGAHACDIPTVHGYALSGYRNRFLSLKKDLSGIVSLSCVRHRPDTSYNEAEL